MGILEAFADDKRAGAIGDRKYNEPMDLPLYLDNTSSAGERPFRKIEEPENKTTALGELT